MKKVLSLAIILGFVIQLTVSPHVSAEIMPYVYKPTVPDTSFAVLALYELGDYDKVLEGCEWLVEIKTPFNSWGYAYGEDHEAKYTAMAIMALIRGESIARGRYRNTINGAAYWLIYKQKPDGSWDDYLDVALGAIALREVLKSGYLDKNMKGLEKQVQEGLSRALLWLELNPPQNDVERIFRDIALGRKDDLKQLKVEGDLEAYRAFGLAYMGERVSLNGNFSTPMTVAMALYATKKQVYLNRLLSMEHFGFWGKLHYRVLDLLDVSRIRGFEDLKHIACPYLNRIPLTEEWQKAVYAHYYVLCSKNPPLPENYSALLPWQVAEIARIKSILGKPYTDAVEYLLAHSTNGTWRDFYNTAYVLWVLKSLNVSYSYNSSLGYLSANLTWMLETKNPKTGKPLYYSVPTYYFSQAAVVFKQFGMEKELDETLRVLRERQYPNGAFAYTQGSVAGITTTARVLWNLQVAGLTEIEPYTRAASYLRKLLYADIPEPRRNNGLIVLKNATFVIVKGSRYVGNSTDEVELDDIDGYVVIYPSKNPLAIDAHPVEGFIALPPKEGGKKGRLYIGIAVMVIALALAIVLKGRKPGK